MRCPEEGRRGSSSGQGFVKAVDKAKSR